MRKILAILGLAVAGFLMGAEASAQPCPDLPPIGTHYTCYFVNGTKVIVAPGGPVPSSSSGSAGVYVVAHNVPPASPVCEAVLSVGEFSSTGQGRLGTVTSNLAPGSPVSRLTGSATTLFPANLELNLNLSVNATGLSNGPFVSQGPLTLRATGIGRLPLRGVTANQVAPIKLTNAKGESIGLESVTVVLNGE